MVLQANIDKLGLVPCEKCSQYDEPENWEDCENHWPERGPRDYTHFLIDKKWYVVPQKYTVPLLSMIPVEMGITLTGSMNYPQPSRINSLTNLFALLRRQGLTDEDLHKVFPPKQVSRMKGRVFNKLVKGK